MTKFLSLEYAPRFSAVGAALPVKPFPVFVPVLTNLIATLIFPDIAPGTEIDPFPFLTL